MWTPVKGWESPHEQGLFAAFAKQIIGNGVIVEIGSEHGMSASIWSQYSPESKIFCIEINNEADFLHNIANAGIATANIEWLKGDSKSVKIPSPVIENGIDILFVDGDHSFEGALADLERWSTFVKSSGVILVHDCACSTNKLPHADHHAVYSAVHNFLATSREWRVAFCVDSTMVLVRL